MRETNLDYGFFDSPRLKKLQESELQPEEQKASESDNQYKISGASSNAAQSEKKSKEKSNRADSAESRSSDKETRAEMADPAESRSPDKKSRGASRSSRAVRRAQGHRP